MKISFCKPQKEWRVAAVLMLTLAGGFVARTAFARIIPNTIDPQATVTDHGRHLIVTLVRTTPLDCTPTERAAVRVTVTQRTTGAVAEGRVLVSCSEDPQRWAVDCWAQGEPAFEAGPATAVSFGRASDHGRATDAHQWLVEITLVEP